MWWNGTAQRNRTPYVWNNIKEVTVAWRITFFTVNKKRETEMMGKCLVKGEAVPIQAWAGPEGSRSLRLPEFPDSWHMKEAALSVVRTGHPYPQETSLVLVSVRVWVDPCAIVRAEDLSQWKIPVTPSGIEPATFLFVAQYLVVVVVVVVVMTWRWHAIQSSLFGYLILFDFIYLLCWKINLCVYLNTAPWRKSST